MVALLEPPAPHLRIAPAEPAEGERSAVSARRLDHSLRARRTPNVHSTGTRLHLNGLSITLDEPLEPGEQLSLHVRGGNHRTWNARGRVASCRPTGAGYLIAIDYDRRPAA
jgi:hypothetical protein